MAETNIVECMLCDKEGTTLEMSAAATPTLGHHVDLGMAAKWFCEPCFMRIFSTLRKHTDWEKGRRLYVYDWQDDCGTWARACVSGCLDEDLLAMESLPEGLKITPADRARLAQLKDKLEDVTQLQDDEDNHLLHRVCRNINKNTFHHPKTGMRKDYDSLVEDFKKLEKLTPEERGRLDALPVPEEG